MEKTLNGRVALVTGGSYGIGRATAIAFAARGARVAIADHVEDKEAVTVTEIKKAGGDAKFYPCDVSDASQVKKLFANVLADFGRLDFAFNNAGIEGVSGTTHECTEKNFDHTIEVNLKGVWLCMREEIPLMLQSGKGSIVNCASVAGLSGFEGLPAYVASKHGVVGLTKTAALEYAKKGIRVNAVCPGVIHTAMVDRITGRDKEVEKQFVAMEPVGRMGLPEEVGEAVVWLSSDAASFVTGAALPVDGGFSA